MKANILKKFEEEIQGLERELKTELPKEIKRAREMGDLSENAEYEAAKERQRYLDARIAMLKKRVAELSLVNLDKVPHDKVGLGSEVHVLEDTGEKRIYWLVMPEEADAASGRISTSSPIGRALLNKEPGDEVVVKTPNGERQFEIMKLTTVHDMVEDEEAKSDSK